MLSAAGRGPRAATVLDVATGTAGVALQIARRTSAHVTGIDITEAMLRRGQAARHAGGVVERIALVDGQAEALLLPDATFDALTFTYLLRYVADPGATIAELARVVRPGGTVASLEFHVPPRPLLRGAWWLYTRVGLPVFGGAGRAGVVPRRALSRPEHLHPLRPLSPPVDRGGVAAGRDRRRRRPRDEPRGRAGHVGAPRRWLTGDPPSMRRRAGPSTGGRSCTRRAPRGISRTWPSARPWHRGLNAGESRASSVKGGQTFVGSDQGIQPGRRGSALTWETGRRAASKPAQLSAVGARRR
jgi:SAM-dependent methyltransferase